MFVKTCIILASGFVVCCGFEQSLEYEEDTGFRNKLCPSSFVTFQKVLRSRSECLMLCSKTFGCNSVVYQTALNVCYGLTNRLACSTFTSTSNANYYKRKCGTIVPLVTGAYGIPDSKIVASSVYDGDFLAHFGRLDGPKAWGALTEGGNDYLQFDFVQLKVFTSIVTQGYHTPAEYVTSYKVLASTDCSTFSLIQTFSGNTNVNGYKSNTFSAPFVARCIRVNPRAWSVWPTMRVEINGCSMLPTQ